MEQSSIIRVDLPINELNVIMTALAERPFREVALIFNRINAQVQPQVAALNARAEAPEAPEAPSA